MIKVVRLYHHIKEEENLHKFIKFSGGEIQPTVSNYGHGMLWIKAHITSSNDIMDLLLTVNAIRQVSPNEKIHLSCPYLPYARQDRVMEKGEALGVKVMCDLINSMNFETVEVWDAHSDVALALLNNVTNFGPETFVQQIPVTKANTILVAPDAGAIKKVFKVAKGLGFEMVTASKHRSTEDGSITDTEVHSGHVGNKDFLIVDDICDGGRTFIELAKKLKPLTDGRILLYVTHGIFSKGIKPLEDLFDGIYVAKPFPNVDLTHPLLCVLPSGQ